MKPRVELLASQQVPPWVADRGMPPDMEGTREIKYPGQTKTSTTALRLTEGSVKARGRKPQKQITWSSRLGVM